MWKVTDRMVRNTQQIGLLLSGQESYVVNAAPIFCVLNEFDRYRLFETERRTGGTCSSDLLRIFKNQAFQLLFERIARPDKQPIK